MGRGGVKIKPPRWVSDFADLQFADLNNEYIDEKFK